MKQPTISPPAISALTCSLDIDIRGVGFYVPERILTNAELVAMVDTTDEWIVTRTGITQRHIAAPDEASSDLALPACQRALEQAGLTAQDVTHLVLATLTPDMYCPSCACILAHKLGVAGITAIDINAACSGFLNGLQVGRGLACLTPDAVILVVAVDKLSSRVNWEDRSTCVLFGDGAGAAVLSRAEGNGGRGQILGIELAADGLVGDSLVVAGGGSKEPYALGSVVGEEFFVKMNGREVFKHAVRNMHAICNQVLQQCGKTIDDVDVLIPHQANLRIIEALGERLGLPKEDVFVNVDRYGNTSAAAVAIALAEARLNGRVKDGDLVLLTTFGGGLTWGAALVQF